MAQPRYQVLDRIDAGGMAEVFKANSSSIEGFEKLVAIKRVLPDLTKNERFVRMFLDEAKVSLHLNHTNIVHVFDLGMADGTYFIVMEFVDGTNLKELIQELAERGARLPVEQAAYIALEVCKGLAHAHAKTDRQGNPLGIVHRDISPPNILLSREGEVKITDFGLAKAKSQAEVTDPGVVKGKFGYLSPEAAWGEAVDARTDVFAVGILLWEMLAGRRLFLGESDYDTLEKVREAKVPDLGAHGCEVPAQLDEVMRRALAREPDDRHLSAEELGRDLADFLFGHGAVVSGFDVASLVCQVIEDQPDTAEDVAVADLAVGEQVQRELNELVSLEDMGNLDHFFSEVYGDISVEVVEDLDVSSGSEDPREWMDLGFGMADAAEVDTPAPEGAGDGWQDVGLGDVARVTQSMPAVSRAQVEQMDAGSGEVSTADAARVEVEISGETPSPSPTPSPTPAPMSAQKKSAASTGQSEERVQAVGHTAPAPAGQASRSPLGEGNSGRALLLVFVLILLVAAALGVFWFAVV